MISIQALKTELLQQMHAILDSKIKDAKDSITSAKESRNNDTKSSAGDKYETGRAMMQMEIDNNELQYSKAMLQKQELLKINASKSGTNAENGSIVKTNFENYFLSIAMGKMLAFGETYYAISLASPLGAFLKNKKAGDSGIFQGREFVIEKIN